MGSFVCDARAGVLPTRRARPPAQDAGSLTSATGLAVNPILEVQRGHGNRQVARSVLSRQPASPALADTATYDNRELAKAIDETRTLDGIALLRRHEQVEAALAAGPTGAELARLSVVRDAIDFVRSERMIGGATPHTPARRQIRRWRCVVRPSARSSITGRSTSASRRSRSASRSPTRRRSRPGRSEPSGTRSPSSSNLRTGATPTRSSSRASSRSTS